MYAGKILEAGFVVVNWLVAVAPLSKYSKSPVAPGRSGRPLKTLPKGLTVRFPSSGVLTDVTLPKILAVSVSEDELA